MVVSRVCAAVGAFLAVAVMPLSAADAASPALPDYKLGDVATADAITPVALQVANPEATEALKQKVGSQVHLVVRQTLQSAREAETALRESIAGARRNFMTSLRQEDFETPEFERAIREAARESPKDLPFGKLAPLWVRGTGEEAFIETLLQPLRETMAQPIVANKTETPLPTNQPLRLVPVKSAEPPGIREIETAGQTISSGKVLSLWRARRLVETHFPGGQEALGRFVAGFVKANAFPDPALTEIWRARRIEGLTVSDTYEAAQVIVRKGQTIDRKAMAALAAMREKSLIGTLQVKLEQEQGVAGQIRIQTKWIAAGLGGVCAVLLLILWRLRSRPAATLSPVLIGPSTAATRTERERGALPFSGAGGDDAWRSRALAAEGKAERAHAAIRSGVLGWMREKVFRTAVHQRAELLSAQQKAEAEIRELEQRLEQLHTPLQERIVAYEKRIEELETDLAAKGEENRELIGARIHVARQQLSVERERSRFGTN